MVDDDGKFVVVNPHTRSVFKYDCVTAANAVIAAWLHHECAEDWLDIEEVEYLDLLGKVHYDMKTDLVSLGDYYTQYTRG